MHKLIVILIILLCLMFLGCGAKTIDQFKKDSSLHEQFEVNLDWQKALYIANNGFAVHHNAGLTCDINSSVGEADCRLAHFRGPGQGFRVAVTIKKITEYRSLVDMYSLNDTSFNRTVFGKVKEDLLNAAYDNN
jgi:hypothetical protein